MAGSAPTSRVVDVVELLCRPGHERLRFSDVVARLGLTQATAHAILTTLSERGWVTRDPST
ncbi:transcriptional regulator, partial [Mycobacterium sp. ITM-2017-0098]